MPTARPWTPDDTTTLRALHKRGMTLHAIAKEMGRSKSIVSRRAAEQDPPLAWDRTRTANATHAHHVDAKARRAAIKDRLYTRAEKLLTRLEAQQFTTLVPDGPGSQGVKTLDFVPTDDERNLAGSISSYLTAAERLEKLDGDGGTTEAIGMLNAIADAIKAAAATLEPAG